MNHQLIIRYKAGDPGGEWSTEEVKITRRQIRMMITPDLYFSFNSSASFSNLRRRSSIHVKKRMLAIIHITQAAIKIRVLGDANRSLTSSAVYVT